MRAAAPSASRDVLREIAGQAMAGGLCFVFLCALAVAADYGGIRSLIARDPALALAQGFAAFLAFAPLVACVAIGCLRRGDQHDVSPPARDDDRPLR